jgi:ABC-2 type transport system permease protein
VPADVVVLVGRSALVVAVGFAFGFRVPVAGLLLGLALLVSLAVSLAALSYAFALALRRQEMRGFAVVAMTVGHPDVHPPPRVRMGGAAVGLG